jgi:hydroxymethylbilane synthase
LTDPAARVLRLGTRASELARAQTAWVARSLEHLHPLLSCRQVLIRTRGDREIDRPLATIGGKGVFVREIEQALLAGEIDLAVHSLKDLPAQLPDGLEIAAVPERSDAADALITPEGLELEALPAGSRVGTGSARRAALLGRIRPDLSCVPLRGNVDTRLRRLEQGRCEALVLAMAGLSRLGRLDGRARRLDPDAFVPAPGQGALAVEARSGSEAAALARGLHHEPSGIAARAERAVVQGLGGGCQLPLGALARLQGELLRIEGFLSDGTPARFVRVSLEAEAARPEEAGRELARRLRLAGGEEILRTVGAF